MLYFQEEEAGHAGILVRYMSFYVHGVIPGFFLNNINAMITYMHIV
jgi:hypothetical protein